MSARRSKPLARWGVLFLLFFLSGISGLIYESIWSRYLRLFVGSAATAQILVLALFMGGMSLGALWAGRFLSRVRAPVMTYGIIEGIIGVYALAYPHLQGLATRLCYDVLFPALGGGVAVTITKWGIASLLILPPCVLLGMTFPLMSVGILRRDFEHSGEILSLLYFTNSLGASIGALLSGFVLVAAVGLPGTLMVAAAVNLSIMLVAVRDRTEHAPIDGSEPSPAAEPTSDREPVAPMVGLLLLVAFGTGLSSFMYEIGWIRLLSMVLGSATHSFEVMLSAFVFGLAVGGLWVRKRMDHFKHPAIVLAIVQLCMGIAAIATLPLYRGAVEAMGWLLSADDRTATTWLAFNVLRYLLSLMIMLPATFCAGMTLPLLTHVLLHRGQAEGIVGRVYGINTFGAIAGAVLAGLVFMPLIGLKGVIILGAAVDLALGVAILRLVSKRAEAPKGARTLMWRASFAAVATSLIGILVIQVDPMVLTATVFRHGRTRLPDEYEILSYVDGRTASVTVVNNHFHNSYHIIYTNGKPDASVVLDRYPEDRLPHQGPDIAGDEPNQFLVGLLPLMLRPEATHGALIGFGSGVSCHTVLGSPTLERLDTIEIEPEMVRGSSYFNAVNYRAYEDPRNHIWFDDAKAYFASAASSYDFIISEPTNPWVSGVSSLFTVEFYQEAKRYLKPGGVLGQWIQGYELSNDLLVSVLAAIDQEFSDYVVIRVGSRDWMILSVAEGEVGQLSPEVLEWEGMRETFELLGIHSIGQVDGLISANRAILHPFLVGRTANRDTHPVLDTGAEKARFMGSSAEFLHSIRWTPAPLLEVLGNIERRPYPLEGIGDLRDPHVLTENEQAALLMRFHESSATEPAEGVTVAAMREWKASTNALDNDEPWEDWIHATYGVYRETVSHFPIHETPWWREVRSIVAERKPPEPVPQVVDLLDALSRLDGPRLLERVEQALETEDYPIPRALLTIAGVVALELVGATASERHSFADEHMADIGYGDDSEDWAYRAIRAYARQ